MTATPSPATRRRALEGQLTGLAFGLPAILGLLAFTLYPVLASLYYSFCRYPVLRPPQWIGTANYERLFEDPLFYVSLGNTVYHALLAVPLGILTALVLALLLNSKVRGISIYRTCFYVPSVVPIVASAMLWIWLLSPQDGAVNAILRMAGVTDPPGWLQSPDWSKPAIVLWTLWSVGGAMIIFLAGLQDVPQELYEAATIDGAGRIQGFWSVTLPFLSPQMLFVLIMGLIGAFQFFTPVYVMTNGTGGPVDSTTYYSIYLFNVAFGDFKMGYACAMAWLLLLLIAGATLVIFRSTARFVYYGGENEH